MYLHILGSKVCMCLHLQDFFFFQKGKERGNIIYISQPPHSSPSHQLQKLSEFFFLTQFLIPHSLPEQTGVRGGCSRYAGGQGYREDWLCRNLMTFNEDKVQVLSPGWTNPSDGRAWSCVWGFHCAEYVPATDPIKISQQHLGLHEMERVQKAGAPGHLPFPQLSLCHSCL